MKNPLAFDIFTPNLFKLLITLMVCVTSLGIGSIDVQAAPGDLDATFGNGGKTTTLISTTSRANAIAIQADGKIVVVGASGEYPNTDFALARYNIHGTLDPSFGNGGTVITPIGNSSDTAFAIAIQADGKIVVAGSSDNVSNSDFAVARYNIDGSLDTSFDGDGKITTPVGISASAYAVIIQSDGKIIAAGGSSASPSNNFALVRYNSDGSLDTSFGVMGKVTTPMGEGIDGASSVAVQSDGKIVAAGDGYRIGSNFDFALVRYNTNGSLDTSFDGDGIVTIGASPGIGRASGLAIQRDGKIVAVGSSCGSSGGCDADFAAVRYNIDGSLDTSFDGDGKVFTPIGSSNDYPSSVAIQSNGKIVVAGGSFNTTTFFDFALVRYNPNGSLDTTFDGDGKLTTVFGSNQDQAMAVAIQPDGKIVAAGSSYNGTNDTFAVARYIGDAVTLFASVDGRILTSDGRGLRNATVSIVDSQGVVRTATTSSFGFFSFANISTGQTYTIRVSSRLYRYSSQTVQVNDNLTLPDFVGLE